MVPQAHEPRAAGSSRLRVLLVNPDPRLALRSEAGALPDDGSGPYPPLGLLCLQAALEARGPHRAQVVDGQFPGELARALASVRRERGRVLVGITALTPNLLGAVQAIQAVREALPEAHVVMGGPHTDLFPEESAALPGVDWVLPGEADLTFPALVEALADDRPPRPGVLDPRALGLGEDARFPDLDRLPSPERANLGVRRYRGLAGEDVVFATLASSRGCPHTCTFCSTPRGRYRYRSVQAIVEEMDACARLGVQHLYFVDDTFPVAGSRLRELCAALSRRRLPPWSCRTAALGLTVENLTLMKRAGCCRIQLGVETCTAEGLAILGKRATLDQIRRSFAAARQVGLPTMAYFMVGLPHEHSADDVRRLFAFARELDPDYALFNVLTLYPGTALLARAEAQGLVAPGLWPAFARSPRREFVPPVWDEHLSRRELFALLDEAYRSFYLRPRVVARQLRRGALLPKVKAGFRLVLSRGRALLVREPRP